MLEMATVDLNTSREVCNCSANMLDSRSIVEESGKAGAGKGLEHADRVPLLDGNVFVDQLRSAVRFCQGYITSNLALLAGLARHCCAAVHVRRIFSGRILQLSAAY